MFSQYAYDTPQLIPVTRVVAGDLLDLRDSPLFSTCPCEVCGRKAVEAQEHPFIVRGATPEVDYYGPGKHAFILDTNRWVVAVPAGTRLPVCSFVEDIMPELGGVGLTASELSAEDPTEGVWDD